MALRLPGRTIALALVLLAAVTGCYHQAKKKADGEMLRSSAEEFHRYVRWGNMSGASRFLAPEQRLDWLKGVIDRKDEELLKITDYELEDAQVSPGKALVLSKMTWYRLPSVTTVTEAMTVTFEERDGAWVITAIAGGPVPLEPPAKPADPPPAPAP